MKTSHTQQGSILFFILIGVALFAALSYVISQQSSGNIALSQERIRLQASDVMDMGKKMADAVARLRINGIADTTISFENDTVSGYTNAACTTDSCKVFSFDGGGLNWISSTTDINGGVDWGISGAIALENMGTSAGDLIAFLPGLSIDTCNRINIMLDIYATGGTPSTIASVAAGKFTGTYGSSALNDSQIKGKSAGCFYLTSGTGTALTGAPLTNTYVYYQVLDSR